MRLSSNGEFIIENYQNQRTFSSFLPGIAGKMGIPIWAFYVNRGQGIASFGIGNKDNAILEFMPANKSYQMVPLKGFRTFIKLEDTGKFYEPFSRTDKNIKNKMTILPHSLIIEEENQKLELRVNVRYFILPNENFASLVRRVKVSNLSSQPRDIEILDGLPELVPYGLTNSALKEVSQTMAAWCRVYNIENKIPFYHVKATTDDSPEVRKMEKGHFYMAFSDDNKLLTPLVDSQVIFAQDTAFQIPLNFLNNQLTDYKGEQMTENRFPSAMSAYKKRLEPDSSIVLNSLFGHLSSEEKLMSIKDIVLNDKYLNRKEEECEKIHRQIMDNIYTKSNYPVFDYYCCQTYLDNLLRGGFPVNISSNEGDKDIYYIYSRKHGDLERDYNYFHLEASNYSQGNGNYRDVNQNRRCDNIFNAEIADFNIKTFANLIQADGYNPLVIKGSRYHFQEKSLEIILPFLAGEYIELLKERLKKSFTPGELSLFIYNQDIKLNIDTEKFIQKVISHSISSIEADFGEGYWVDHWTYLLDLIESFIAVYPEKKYDLFINDNSYTFYDSYVRVKPRSAKYLLTDLGPRQLSAIEEDKEKKELIESRSDFQDYLRTENGKGRIYRTSLLVKLLTLITNKISSLDPYGVGIEMEANKPGWYDALNGLPGIFGSSTPESMELKRLVDYLLSVIDKINVDTVKIPIELLEFINEICRLTEKWTADMNNYYYWNNATSLREGYREKVFYGFKGEEEELSILDLKNYFKLIKTKLEYGINQAAETDYDLYSTYYYYIPLEYTKTERLSQEGYPIIEVSKFEQVVLPPFLEGQVRAMKVLETNNIKKLHDKVKNSELFDSKLRMYRLNGDLSEMPDDIGRARAFTPGWLENGSIWLHMEYKYLLELIKNGLYDDFYQSVDDCLIPFQDPERYGRSILENSSFIMSSSNPDKENHGRGYIARLSGSTAEFLNIWSIMVFGNQPFKILDSELVFKPEPVLKGGVFTSKEEDIQIYQGENLEKHSIPENSFACSLFGKTLLVYHNPARKDTYKGSSIKGYKVTMYNGETEMIENAELNSPYSKHLREGKIKRIDIYLD